LTGKRKRLRGQGRSYAAKVHPVEPTIVECAPAIPESAAAFSSKGLFSQVADARE